MSDSSQEARVRRAAKRIGWRIEKSRARNLHSNDRGLYQLIDGNTVIGGVDYDATLDAIAHWIGQEAARRA